MSLTEKIKPINNTHSIKEAVISVFLVNPILKPERFQTLIEGDLSEKFQQFEDVGRFRLELNQEKGITNPDVQVINNIGFKFSNFEKGRIQRILQGINEEQRTFISYHSLGYSRWKPFLEEFKQSIEALCKIQSDLFVSAYSLHYIDEFFWIDETTPIDLRLIFKEENTTFPKVIFDSKNANYSLITEKEIGDIKYHDRLEITISSNIKSFIRISHNITRTLDDIYELNKIVKENKFEEVITMVHESNKLLLKEILTIDILNMINLI